jgi:plasmid stabilization system protein ParE
MSRAVRILERAGSDVDNIFNRLVHRWVQGAISWYLAFHQALEKIAVSPENFAEAAESHQLGHQLRETLFKTRRGRVYRIVFQASETEITVLRIRGPGQSPLRRRDLPDR